MTPRLPSPPIIRGQARDCTCTPARPHGTQHVYDYHSCGCDACRAGHRRYLKTGSGRKADAAQVRARLALLKARGYTVREIAQEAGVAANTLFVLLRSDRATCHSRTARAVMSVIVPDPVTEPRHVTAHRIAELEHLVAGGVDILDAVPRAGFPRRDAALDALRTHGPAYLRALLADAGRAAGRYRQQEERTAA